MSLRPSLLLMLLALPFSSCASAESSYDFPYAQSYQTFTCAREKNAIPKHDPEADQLYVHALWLKKNNLLKEDPLAYQWSTYKPWLRWMYPNLLTAHPQARATEHNSTWKTL